ncbi:hypothetical protein SDC9_210380 [bioreactor metagenome]|uniref:Uncharacterized protein n=1 Tax=bioreactor metagenome TaxID=1076179 RepID=A0A645JG01_9ZZZZ
MGDPVGDGRALAAIGDDIPHRGQLPRLQLPYQDRAADGQGGDHAAGLHHIGLIAKQRGRAAVHPVHPDLAQHQSQAQQQQAVDKAPDDFLRRQFLFFCIGRLPALVIGKLPCL